ncbi:hypothetical protein [Erythrobacter tepidarius]|uniref:hypothetical protein n=1 Tax=Erythrobacter tepidarius TaxID=60454 RepID=UPI000A3B8418|nr:hypothetical protein [Erythrobacter tepidarius]
MIKLRFAVVEAALAPLDTQARLDGAGMRARAPFHGPGEDARVRLARVGGGAAVRARSAHRFSRGGCVVAAPDTGVVAQARKRQGRLFSARDPVAANERPTRPESHGDEARPDVFALAADRWARQAAIWR